MSPKSQTRSKMDRALLSLSVFAAFSGATSWAQTSTVAPQSGELEDYCQRMTGCPQMIQSIREAVTQNRLTQLPIQDRIWHFESQAGATLPSRFTMAPEGAFLVTQHETINGIVRLTVELQHPEAIVRPGSNPTTELDGIQLFDGEAYDRLYANESNAPVQAGSSAVNQTSGTGSVPAPRPEQNVTAGSSASSNTVAANSGSTATGGNQTQSVSSESQTAQNRMSSISATLARVPRSNAPRPSRAEIVENVYGRFVAPNLVGAARTTDPRFLRYQAGLGGTELGVAMRAQLDAVGSRGHVGSVGVVVGVGGLRVNGRAEVFPIQIIRRAYQLKGRNIIFEVVATPLSGRFQFDLGAVNRAHIILTPQIAAAIGMTQGRFQGTIRMRLSAGLGIAGDRGGVGAILNLQPGVDVHAQYAIEPRHVVEAAINLAPSANIPVGTTFTSGADFNVGLGYRYVYDVASQRYVGVGVSVSGDQTRSINGTDLAPVAGTVNVFGTFDPAPRGRILPEIAPRGQNQNPPAEVSDVGANAIGRPANVRR